MGSAALPVVSQKKHSSVLLKALGCCVTMLFFYETTSIVTETIIVTFHLMENYGKNWYLFVGCP
jgi:hypothetical protein